MLVGIFRQFVRWCGLAGGICLACSFLVVRNASAQSVLVNGGTSTIAVDMGTTVSIATAGGSVASRYHWVGLYAPGASDTNYLEWNYLTGTHTATATSVTGATFSVIDYRVNEVTRD